MRRHNAPPHQARPLVLFVCRHGAAKSVLAAAELERMAESVGIDIEARARGVEPAGETATAVLALLPDRASALRAQRPRRVSEDDIRASSLTITFNLDESELPTTAARTIAWDEVPAISEHPAEAREAIDRRIVDLLESMARGRVAG
jgi:arsenate reductase